MYQKTTAKSLKTSPFDYGYAIGVLRVLEMKLLNGNEVERMMLGKDAKDSLRILNELDYASQKHEHDNPSEFQQILNNGLLESKNLLRKLTPNDRILNILWFDFDFHNIKTLLKAKLSGKKYEEIAELMSKMGAIDPEKLREYILDDKENTTFDLNKKTEKFIKQAIAETIENFEKSKKDPQTIDLTIDKAYIKLVLQKAKESGSEFLISYIQKFIDFANIHSFIRVKMRKKDCEQMEMAFIEGGNLKLKDLIEAYKKDLAEFPAQIKIVHYQRVLLEGVKKLLEENSMMELEKIIENELTEKIRETKYLAYGPEPLLAYFLAKKNNALILRMILINKLNNIDPEEIRTRLRKLYV